MNSYRKDDDIPNLQLENMILKGEDNGTTIMPSRAIF